MNSSEFLSMWSDYLTIINDFLMNGPGKWFIALYVGFFALSMVKDFLHLNDKI